jgi:spermidine/putrescine ABC transporter ATP-binding subunit
MGQVALSATEVVKRYSDQVAIGPISLDVQRGEFFSLLGESGSGKTTLLRCIAGFEAVTSGTIELDGQPIHHKPAHRRNVGLVFQNYALFPHQTVFDNVAFGLKLRRVPRETIAKRVADVLNIVGMPDLGERYPSQLSGGQQQRVAIARSLVLEPPLILFDEPLSNLDAKLRIQLRTELRSLQRRLGMTCIFVTHDQSEAFALSDRIAVLANGSIAQIGTPSEIYEAPSNAYVAKFVGNCNQIRGTVVGKDAAGSVVQIGEGLRLSTRDQSIPVGSGATVLFRPEQVQLPQELSPSANRLKCVIEDTLYLGEDTQYRLMTAGKVDADPILIVRKSSTALNSLRIGSEIEIGLEPSRIHLFAGSVS